MKPLRAQALPSFLPSTSRQRAVLRSGLRAGLCVGLCAIALPTGVWAQESSPALEYLAREVMIPMRDGVKLYTQIFEPQDLDDPSPILFTRTPYGVDPVPRTIRAARLGPSPSFADAAYIFVRQDVRGQFQSEGEWDFLRPARLDATDPKAVDESTDTYDTIQWLLDNLDGDNGRVGMWGISYDGWQAVMALAEPHPALLAVSPQASPADTYVGDDFHHNGAFRLAYMFSWIGFMAVMRGDAERNEVGRALGQKGYDFFSSAGSLGDLEASYFHGKVSEWTDTMEHGDYDEFWKLRNPLPLLDDVQPAVLNVAGWFDAEDFRGPIDIYHTIERSDDDDGNTLVVGPWMHGGWSVLGGGDGQKLGDLNFGEATAEWFQWDVELPFFEHHLRGAEDPYFPEVFAFETGANVWQELDSWPPASVEPRALYLQAGGIASFVPPDAGEEHTAFLSDPADPVPYTAKGPVVPQPQYMVEDQRFLEGRDDVLSFLTEPLEQDLVIAGRTGVELHFSTTGTDADWIVKLIDVYPDDTEETSSATGESLAGAQILLSADIFRAKYRKSFEHPSALEPDELTELTFELPDRFHHFRAGHRILVQVHSTWFPMYDRNPQVFTDIYHADEEDFAPATHRLFHRQGAGSLLHLPVLAD